MASTNTIRMTRDQFTAKEAAAKAHGFTIAEDKGQLAIPTPMGNIIVSYVYSEPNQVLELTTIHKPFLVPESAIEKQENQLLS